MTLGKATALFTIIAYTSVFGFFAHAATLSVSPSSGGFEEGEQFTVDVVLDTEGVAANALSGELQYPTNLLQAISISTGSSVVPFWITTPQASGGLVTFEGMIPNPGFTGGSGNIVSVTLEALQTGTATLSFNSASVLANDGLATELLSATYGATFGLNEATTPPVEPPEPPVEPPVVPPVEPPVDPGDGDGDGGGFEIPNVPNIVSDSHPNQSLWYQSGDVTVAWENQPGVNGMRVSITENAPGEPDVSIDPALSSYTFNVGDGVWYANAQFQNPAGWGEVGSIRVQVDTSEPSGLVVRQVASDETRPGVFSSDFGIEAFDLPSGISYFEITIDSGETVRWEDPGDGIFRVRGLSAGDHIIVVKGFDRAGNNTVTEAAFKFTVFDPIGVGKTIVDNPIPENRLERVPLPQTFRPEVVEVVSYAGFGAGLGQVLVLSANALSFADMWLLILRFFSFVASFFRRRKSEPWGVVYDSVTKQPLDPAYVVIKRDGKQEGMAITDLDGRYGFLVSPGMYTLEANKTHYKFPSEKLAGRTHDEFYDNLYFGKEIRIESDTKSLVSYNIPLDPVGFDWNEFAKRERGLFYVHSKRKRVVMVLSNIIFYVGLAISTYIFWYNPSPLNSAIFGLYAVILLYQTFWHSSHPITKIMTKLSKEVIPFAVIKAHIAGSDRLVKTVVADENGHFYMLTPPGEYYFTVEVKEEDGSYSEKYRTSDVNLKKGVVLKNVYIQRSDSSSHD